MPHCFGRIPSFCPAGVQDIKFLNKEQESEAKHFKDPATNVDLDVTDKVGRLRISLQGGRGIQRVCYDWCACQ